MVSESIPDGLASRVELRTEPVDGGVRVVVRGEIDLADVDEVAAVLAAAERTEARTILLDLSAVTFIDSTGLRLLLEAQARSRQNGNRLRIVPSRVVARVVALSGIQDRLPLNPIARPDAQQDP